MTLYGLIYVFIGFLIIISSRMNSVNEWTGETKRPNPPLIFIRKMLGFMIIIVGILIFSGITTEDAIIEVISSWFGQN